MFLVAGVDTTDGYLVAMAVGGVGFGAYMAVDLALVVDVLPDATTAAKDLGVLNIAGALPFALAPAIAPAVLAIGAGSYAVLYCAAAACALLSAVAIQPVKRVQ
jgi:MFS family permease